MRQPLGAFGAKGTLLADVGEADERVCVTYIKKGGTVQMKQGETGMSFRHAPGKLLVIGRFLEKIVSALLPRVSMLVCTP